MRFFCQNNFLHYLISLILETPFFLRESTLLLKLLFRIHDTLILPGLSLPVQTLKQLHLMLRSLLVNIESLQKDPLKLIFPAQCLYDIYNDPKYEDLKEILKSKECLSVKSKHSDTPKSQRSSSANFSSKEVSIEQLNFQANSKSPNNGKNHFSFSEMDRLSINSEILKFSKLKSHQGFASGTRMPIHDIESFSIELGVGTNYFVEPGTIMVRKVSISQAMIDSSPKNILVLFYKVRIFNLRSIVSKKISKSVFLEVIVK